MKKFIAGLFALVLAALPFTATGCNTLSNDDWKEVQSVTYTIGTESTTLKSKLYWNFVSSEIEKTEYDNAPESQKLSYSMYSYMLFEEVTGLNVSINRKQFISDANNKVGSTYFTFIEGEYETENSYHKATYSSYTIEYVKVKILSDTTIDIKYGDSDSIIKINTNTYEITYFKE